MACSRKPSPGLGLAAVLTAAILAAPSLAAAADPNFSLVVLPDTQYYSRYFPSIFLAQTSWIVSHRSTENVQFVLHMGDLTDQNLAAQWSVANQAFATLDSAGVPYSVLPGNHDYYPEVNGALVRDLANFNGSFGPSRFSGKSWYGGHYGSGNESNYNLFDVGSLKFLAINLEFAPRKDVLCWANDLADRYPDRRVIVSTHCYQASSPAGAAPGGHQTDCGTAYNVTGSGGDDVWRELVRRQNNVFLVLSGHIHDSEHMARNGLTSGHVVQEILTDYQFEKPAGTGTNSGNGWLRMLRFVPSANRVDVASETVIPDDTTVFPNGVRFYTTDVYSSDPTAADHRFSFSYDMTSAMPAHNAHSGAFEPFNDRTVNSAGGGQQYHPAVATSSGGRFVVAWQDDQDGNGYYQILVRGFDPTGCESFHDLTVNTVAAGQQINPAIATDASGNFVVVWQDDQDQDGNYDIYARGFTSTGAERFAQVRVNPTATGQHRNPKVAMDSSGNFVVTWEDDTDGNGYYQVLARGFTASGVQRLATFTVNSVADGQQLSPAIGMNAAGDFVVAWEDDQDSNGSYQILARGFNASGSQRFADRTVNSVAEGQQRHPALAVDGSGNFVVVWEDDQDGNGSYQILARGFTASGATRIADFTVNTVASGQQLTPVIAMNPSGNFAVTWADDQDGNGSYQLLARGFTSSGAQRFGPVTVNAGANGQQIAPSISMDASGDFVVAWEDDIDGDGYFEIVARGLSASGTN